MQMIRVKIFSDDQELILRPHHSGIFLGYLRPTGFIETTANAQFRRFVESKQLVRRQSGQLLFASAVS